MTHLKTTRHWIGTGALSVVALALFHTPAQAANRCPSDNFAGFLKTFVSDVVVQRAHTRVPLTDEKIDANAEPEPRPVRRMLDSRHIRFPLVPGLAEQQRKRMTMRSRAVAGGMETTLRTGETDEQVRLLFQQEKGCWTLVRRSDDSL